jgi:hypothetical protein
MGKAQNNFLNVFKAAFAQRFSSNPVIWIGGQIAGNVAQLPGVAALRRGGVLRPSEQFEIGDLRTDFLGLTIVIEYEQKQLPLSNLVKYWPYIRGELSVKPQHPLILCHFSDWWSYGTYRDLWDWVVVRMQADGDRIVDIYGRQFDHGGADIELRDRTIQTALDWIEKINTSDKAIAT